ncbi:MAG: bifunctional 5,10-methylenetetrahydrofolate dehydrogenase/5,10-methenyltetrahydrofolate cyclohydrolase [Elusimicrobiota bacterium]|nr:bifunctional 5,10-methylenetetrahydrofolate dehydrogenase/5,10-methenyltetrahydrofolate cyclohydrolase [Elusimicrobiota bacterium]
MAGKIIDGKSLAAKFKEDIKREVGEWKDKNKVTPLLAAIQVGENPASRVYVKSQRKSCEEVGIDYQLQELPEATSEEELLQFVEKLNRDDKVTGIILEMPLPQKINARRVQRAISTMKDVEGMSPSNMGMLVYGSPRLAPCTALAAMELLKSTGVDIKGKEVTVVGHSEIVGKPVTLFLLSSVLESATPTVCHIATRDLASHTRNAEILIVAVGKAGLIKGDMIKQGAIVIDVGINRVPVLDEQGKPVVDSEGKRKMKTVGDVVFEEAVEKASYITPVPGGVGPLTVVMLLRNALTACKWQREKKG